MNFCMFYSMVCVLRRKCMGNLSRLVWACWPQSLGKSPSTGLFTSCRHCYRHGRHHDCQPYQLLYHHHHHHHFVFVSFMMIFEVFVPYKCHKQLDTCGLGSTEWFSTSCRCWSYRHWPYLVVGWDPQGLSGCYRWILANRYQVTLVDLPPKKNSHVPLKATGGRCISLLK